MMTKKRIVQIFCFICYSVLFAAVLTSLVLTLTSCGHNGFMFSAGQYANLGYDPQTGRTGVMYINGQQVSVLNRENTTIEIELKDSINAEGETVQSIHKIKYSVGSQINGYTVDLEKLKQQKGDAK